MHFRSSIFTTAEKLILAKQRIHSFDWARSLQASLQKDAECLAQIDLPVFDLNWWRNDGSNKDWREIYPQIHQKTCIEPAAPIRLARNAAILCALNDNCKLLKLIKNVLLHYVSYSFEYEHPDVGLNWAVWGIPALETYNLLRDGFNSEECNAMDGFFESMYEAILHNDEWWLENNPGGKFNNHFAWHKLFIGAYGLVYDRNDLVDYALFSDQGFKDLIENGVVDGGLWFESSLNYHFTALAGINLMARMLRNCGHAIDLYNDTFANGRSLRQLFVGIIETVFPDLSIPTVGDAYGKKVKLQNQSIYLDAWDAYRDEVIGWIINKSPKNNINWLFLEELPSVSKAPPAFSILLPEHGYCVLRSEEDTKYWDGKGYAVFFSFDRDSIHAHRDKFNIVIYANGNLILQDPEALSTEKHAFSSQIQSQLNRSTICHNTVMVDFLDHNPIDLKLTLSRFSILPEMKTVEAEDIEGRVYQGVRMRRTISVCNDCVLDVFQVASESEHTYDFLLHGSDINGKSDIDGYFTAFALPDHPPFSWIRNAEVCRKDSTIKIRWQNEKSISLATILEQPETSVIRCDFPHDDTFAHPPIPMVFIRRKCKSTAFIACYQAGEAFQHAILNAAEERNNALRITADIGGKVKELIVNKLR